MNSFLVLLHFFPGGWWGAASNGLKQKRKIFRKINPIASVAVTLQISIRKNCRRRRFKPTEKCVVCRIQQEESAVLWRSLLRMTSSPTYHLWRNTKIEINGTVELGGPQQHCCSCVSDCVVVYGSPCLLFISCVRFAESVAWMLLQFLTKFVRVGRSWLKLVNIFCYSPQLFSLKRHILRAVWAGFKVVHFFRCKGRNR